MSTMILLLHLNNKYLTTRNSLYFNSSLIKIAVVYNKTCMYVCACRDMHGIRKLKWRFCIFQFYIENTYNFISNYLQGTPYNYNHVGSYLV